MENHFYKDKVCVVTGAASGIGLATVKMLLQEEAIIYAIDCKPVDVFGVITLECDLADKNSIDEAFLNIPDKIDCFFGVAGVSGAKTDYYTTFTVNFIANKYITEEYLSQRMNLNGSICYVSSVAGNYWDKYSSEFKPFIKANTWDKMIDALHKRAEDDTVGVMAYPLSKRALNYYMAEKSLEFGDRSIRVNALLPASTDTGMMEEFKVEAGGYDELLSQTGVANRLATSEEMASPLLFLNNSDLASFISGICLTVDYGNDAMIKIGRKRDRLDMKVGSKLFNMGFVQNQLKKQLEPLNEGTEEDTSNEPSSKTYEVEYDEDGIEIL